jgi:hypothetical protein
LIFTGAGLDGTSRIDALISTLVIAGWTGRDSGPWRLISSSWKSSVWLAKINTCFYRAAVSLLTLQPVIEVVGGRSSDEAEPVLELEIEDPIRRRKISHAYPVIELPIEG